MDTYANWKDIIEELDANTDLNGSSQQFIIDLVEKHPAYLTPKQVAWLEDLKRRYLL